MTDRRAGLVSVVLVNFRGTDDTLAAIEHLGRLEWPSDALEIVVVENGSGDDSERRIRAAAPHVRLVVSPKNLGFAGGCNLGVAQSSGEVIGFLNNDARPDPGWVAAAMAEFAASPSIGAVASRVLDWEGHRVDYIDGALAWYGMGYKPLTGERVRKGTGDVAHDVLFGTGSAMFVRADVFEALGGFDERYFMFFEDVDLGWRLNLQGWRYRYAPASLAYHRHHASMRSYGEHKEHYLLERNALLTLYKNLDDDSLRDVLPAAMALSVRRGVTRGGLDSASFDLRAGGDDGSDLTFPAVAAAPLFAIDQFVATLPSSVAARAQVQETRVLSDAAIWPLFGLTDAPVLQDRAYLDGYENLVAAFDVLARPRATRVLVITGDPIGLKIAGPAIRAWNFAEALSRTCDVTLVSLTGVEPIDAPFALAHVAPGDDRAMAAREREADVIVFQGHALAMFGSLRASTKTMVVDIYDPMHLEQLEQGRELPASEWSRQVGEATDTLNEQLLRGDFFLCASERQRDFYLGQLAALGRLNPETYADDPDLRGLIDVVPFGLPALPPRHKKDVLKGVLPGIDDGDQVLLWGGGLYNWFDPLSLIRAVAELAPSRPRLRLFFQGTKHPHPGVPEMDIVARSRALASDLGVLDRHVFFNPEWVEYAERESYLLEADAGVSTHHAHIETTFSFRTRILDYLWAGLPMVVTAGDHFADLVEREGLGVVVPADDVAALAAAIDRVLYDPAFAQAARDNVARVRLDYAWDRVLEPLVRFTAAPRPARDRDPSSPTPPARRREAPPRRTGFARDAALAAQYLRTGGPGVVAQKIARRLRRRILRRR
jgi:hypothetical protein